MRHRFVFAAMLIAATGLGCGIAAAQSAAQPGVQPASSSTTAGFTPVQHAEVVAIVRDTLRSDPGLLREALAAMQADDRRLQQIAVRGAIDSNMAVLEHEPGDPVVGNPAGDVTVVEFYDVRCPYCRQMLPVIDTLLAQDHGVRLVLKDLPVLGPASVLGARALLAAQKQDGYAAMQQAVMKGTPSITPDVLQTEAAAAGLNWSRMQGDMQDATITKRLQDNIELARALQIQGTPAIIVGDKMFPGAVELADLQQAIAAVRGKH